MILQRPIEKILQSVGAADFNFKSRYIIMILFSAFHPKGFFSKVGL